jgi:hypothetical protein
LFSVKIIVLGSTTGTSLFRLKKTGEANSH